MISLSPDVHTLPPHKLSCPFISNAFCSHLWGLSSQKFCAGVRTLQFYLDCFLRSPVVFCLPEICRQSVAVWFSNLVVHQVTLTFSINFVDSQVCKFLCRKNTALDNWKTDKIVRLKYTVGFGACITFRNFSMYMSLSTTINSFWLTLDKWVTGFFTSTIFPQFCFPDFLD